MVDSGYRSRKPLIATTNLTLEEWQHHTALVVFGYFKQDTIAAEKMMKVLEAENAAGRKPSFTA